MSTKLKYFLSVTHCKGFVLTFKDCRKLWKRVLIKQCRAHIVVTLTSLSLTASCKQADNRRHTEQMNIRLLYIPSYKSETRFKDYLGFDWLNATGLSAPNLTHCPAVVTK